MNSTPSRRDHLSELLKRRPELTLHAAEIRFVHPLSGERVSYTAPLAADFAAMLAWTERELAP